MKKCWSVEIKKVLVSHGVLIGIPLLGLLWIQFQGYSLNTLHKGLSTLFLFSAGILILESSVSIFRRFATRPNEHTQRSLNPYWDKAKIALRLGGARRYLPTPPLPRCSVIVAAYLPNEQDIILDTLMHLLESVHRPTAGLEVILAYNTPIALPIEVDLQNLAKQYPELLLLKVEGSRSKAENLNAALAMVTGEITCVLDADHHPAPDCFGRAWRWLSHRYDVVQGRNIIRNHDQNWLTQVIAIEFESIYGISHPAVSFLTDSSIFAGSNGYWRTATLKQVCFDARMLTEDIDATLRALSRGYRIVHDRSIITSELAPTDLLSFWFQRKRWAQGWIEVGFKYQRFIGRFPKFTRLQKIYWTSLLYGCQIYPVLSLQIFPVLLSLMLVQELRSTDDRFLWLVAGLGLLSVIYKSLAIQRIAAWQYPTLAHFKHLVLFLPMVMLKNTIAIVGLYDHLRGDNTWWITPRTRPFSPRRSLTKKLPFSTAKL